MKLFAIKAQLMISIVLFLSACATIAPPTSTTTVTTPKYTWAERQTSLKRIHQWQINGKIAVQTAQDSGSASFNWTQINRQYELSIMGPLGSGSIKLTGQPGAVLLITADGKSYTAKSAEQLLAERWGFNLPLSSLTYWIRGLPVPDMTYSKQLDTENRLSELTQQGWQIQFLNYTTVGKNDLPNKLAITSPVLKTKLIIYSWNAH